MQVIPFVGCNVSLKKPEDWDEAIQGKCVTLPCMIQKQANGVTTISSIWKPNEEEMNRLAAGCPIVLTVIGPTTPPLSLNVLDVTAKTIEDEWATAVEAENAAAAQD